MGMDGKPVYPRTEMNADNGGILHNPSTWNNRTGQWEKGGINWGAAGPLLGAVGIGGAVAAPLLAGGGAAAGAGGTGAATTGAGTGAATTAAGVLPSTTIGTGMVGPITGGTGMAGSSGGFLSTLKSAYDAYSKGKEVYDAGKGVYDTVRGPSTASKIGQTAGSIEQGRLAAMIAQAKIQQEQDALALSRTRAGVDVGNLNLAQQKSALAAPGQLAGQSVRGDVLANSQDATISGLPSYIHPAQISGGLRPSMLSASSRAMGGNMSRQALADQMSGKYTTMRDLPTVPEATPLPEAGKLDTALQWTAGAGSFLDALGRYGGGGRPASASTASAAPVTPPVEGPAGPALDDAGAPLPDLTPPPNPDQGGTGIDPEILKWLNEQADPNQTGRSGG